jgi:hypothetical protein
VTDAVAVKARAIDDVLCGQVSSAGVNDSFIAALGEAQYLCIGEDGSALRANQVGILLAYKGVVGNASHWNVEPANARAVWLDFEKLRAVQKLECFEAIRNSALEKNRQCLGFTLVRRDNHFPADFVGKIMLTAESHHRGGSFNAEPCLQRARFVVNARVNDSAIVSALVSGDASFFFKHRQAQAWKRSREMHGSRKADDACTYNDDIELILCHGQGTA